MKAAIPLLSLLLLSACGYRYHDSISGSGRVERKTMLEDTVRVIEISEKLNAVIVPSDSNKVDLHADDNLFDIVKLDFYDGTLKISSEKYIRMARECEVIVYSNSIHSVQASSKSNVTNEGVLNSESLHLSLSSGATMSIKGKFVDLQVDCSSGSDLDLKGTAKTISISTSSAADVNAYNLVADNAGVDASSVSDVRLKVLKRAMFTASSAADIKYRGAPLYIDIQKSSLGDVMRVRD